MKRMKLMLVSVLAVLTMGLAVAQKVTPISDFEYELTKDGMGISLKKYKGTDTEIVMPSEIEGMPVTEIPDGRRNKFFANYDKIVSVVLPSNLKALPALLFQKQKALKRVTLPDGLEDINFSAFEECPALESIEIPDTVTYIGSSAFRNCKSLQTVVLPKNLEQLQGAFTLCEKLETITIPDSVTKIDEWTFGGCKNLKSVNIPVSCERIENYAFAECESLSEIIIPESIEKIELFDKWSNGSSCFRNCKSLPLATQAKLRRLGYKGEF